MVHALTNVVRRTSSYIPSEEMLRMVTSELNTQNLETLKEIARVLGIKGITRKAELTNEIKHRVTELSTAPLTHSALLLEAQRRDVPMVGFSYQDLRVLFGYDKIENGGVVYLGPQHTSLGTILTHTEPGSYQRLSRLSRDSRALSEWDNLQPDYGIENKRYQALFAKVLPLTEEVAVTPLLYTSRNDPIGILLLNSAPGSPLRQRLLQDYDPTVLQEFKQRHSVTNDLFLQVTLPLPQGEGDKQFYYTHDRDPILPILATTAPNTLKRYVALASLEIPAEYALEYCLEDFCTLLQLTDQRPQKLRDYLPSELSTLPLPILQSFALREGIAAYGSNVTQNIDTLLDQLQLAYVSPTFLQPNRIERTTQTQTSLHTPFDEVPAAQLYAYGIREGTGSYTYFEREELKASFEASNSFLNHYNNETFSRTAIQRLYVLSLNDCTEGAEEFRTCLKTLLAQTAALHNEEAQLLRALQDRVEIVAALEAVLEVGLYMRRWDGNLSKYPLTVAETKPVDGAAAAEEDQHFTRVEQSMERMKVAIDGLPSLLRQKMWELPLRNYMRSGYYAPTDPDDGKTVKDRYDIVREGNHPSAPMASCVRLSSGWFVFTALYYYSKVFGENLRGLLPHQFEYIS